MIVRRGAGVLVLAGFAASSPCLVAGIIFRQRRPLLFALGAIAIMGGVAVEAIVTIAPQPWFTF